MSSSLELSQQGQPRAKSKSIKPTVKNRLSSLDAYRGLIMVLLVSSGFGLHDLAHNPPGSISQSGTWQAVLHQFSHLAWEGITIWDMIQPSFMFMVGVSMPFSYGKRSEAGHTYWQSLRHALVRGIILVLLGIFLRSLHTTSTNFFFMDVVAQIGLGYVFLFLLWNRKFWIQALALVLILVSYWGLFAAWSLPAENFDATTVGVTGKYADAQFAGFEAHWNMNVHPAHYFDVWFRNLFPQPEGKPFVFEAGGYNTLNFIPSLATMILGLMAGGVLKSESLARDKLLLLFFGGLVCIGIGWGIDHLGICPIVKRIWTPSWAIYSGGFCLVIMAVFYLMVDIFPFRKLAFPLVVVGMNSIAIYVMIATMKSQVVLFYKRHLGENIFEWTFLQKLFPQFDALVYTPIIENCMILLLFWIILYWMYRNRFFVRV